MREIAKVPSSIAQCHDEPATESRAKVKLLVLVVLFKVAPEASQSLISLAAQRGVPSPHIVIWDNSPEPCSAASRGWLRREFSSSDYHHCPHNWPLSRTYNSVIDTQIKQQPTRFSHLLLLDHDSSFELSFLDVAVKAIQNFPSLGLFLPLVQAGGQIVSPARMFYFKGSFWRHPRPGAIRFKFKTAINSGMIVSSDYLINKFPGYPSTLSFYGTDNWFCEKYSEQEDFACVFDSTILHDLSQFNIEEIDLKLWRHREIIRAARMINSTGFLRRYACLLFTTLTSARMAFRFRDRRFLKC